MRLNLQTLCFLKFNYLIRYKTCTCNIIILTTNLVAKLKVNYISIEEQILNYGNYAQLLNNICTLHIIKCSLLVYYLWWKSVSGLKGKHSSVKLFQLWTLMKFSRQKYSHIYNSSLLNWEGTIMHSPGVTSCS